MGLACVQVNKRDQKGPRILLGWKLSLSASTDVSPMLGTKCPSAPGAKDSGRQTGRDRKALGQMSSDELSKLHSGSLPV